MRYFLFIFTLFALVPTSSKALDLGGLLHTCKTHYQACIDQMPEALRKVEPASLDWFSLQLYRLDAQFYLQQIDALAQSLDELEGKYELPPRLALKVYIYRSKIAAYAQENADVTRYTEKAAELLSMLKAGSNDPYFIIDYANFQIYLKEYPKGINALLPLEEKFRNHPNASIKSQIYTNLGNLYSHNDELKLSLKHFKLAHENALLDINVTNKIMTLYNVARAYQKLEMYTEARPVFIEVLEQATQQQDELFLSLSNFRLGELLVLDGQHQQAQQYLEKVENWTLSPSQTQELEALLSHR